MSNLSIKDVPDAWAQELRQRASRNHRSLQGELMAIIEHAIQQPATSPRTGLAVASSDRAPAGIEIDRFGHPIIRRGSKTIEQIAAEHRVRFPEPIRGGPLSVDIIRADRDSR
ncbi:MAG: Arc family DNA-binding protein [Ramlibacter sp.]